MIEAIVAAAVSFVVGWVIPFVYRWIKLTMSGALTVLNVNREELMETVDKIDIPQAIKDGIKELISLQAKTASLPPHKLDVDKLDKAKAYINYKLK